MSGIYIGDVSGKTRKMTKLYTGGDKALAVKGAWVGVDGKARTAYTSTIKLYINLTEWFTTPPKMNIIDLTYTVELGYSVGSYIRGEHGSGNVLLYDGYDVEVTSCSPSESTILTGSKTVYLYLTITPF
jgi:hypothetical protein